MKAQSIITIVGLGTIGCSGMTTPVHPPPEPIPFDDPPPLGEEISHEQLRSHTVLLNPQVNGKVAYRAKGRCFVHGEFEEPPTSVVPPPVEYITCPQGLLDHKWEACPGGTVRSDEHRRACSCDQFGNPPPPARVMTCPEAD